jgi:hypothetical protein
MMDRVAVMLVAFPGFFAVIRIGLMLRHEPLTVRLVEHVFAGVR